MKQNSIDQKQVDQVARLLNIAYNSAFLYGSSHPTTKKNIVPLFGALGQCFQIQPMISFIITQDTMFVEDLAVDKKIGMNKIIQHFGKMGIASITFDTAVRVEDIEFFVKLSGDLNQLTTADVITGKIVDGNIRGIRINYVRYGKITNDEKVVSNSSAVIDGNIATASLLSENESAASQFEQLLSLSTLLERPEKAATILSEAIQNDTAGVKALEFIGKLRSDIESAQPQSLEMLLNAIYELKLDLTEAVEIQKVTGKIMSRPDIIKGKMTELTCDTILKLVKEEYASGKLPVKRLAHIIIRMLPDYSEFKQILPKLKELLLAEGMSVTEYLELIRMIDLEIESDELSGSLNEAAKGIGVTVGELAEAIRKEPQDTAKLIFLAAELRQGTYDNDEQLSGVLSDYIEKISSNIALQSRELAGPQGSKALKKMLIELETQFLQRLKDYGVEMPILMKIKDQLSGRLNTVFETTVEGWMKTACDGLVVPNSQELSEKLKNFMGADIPVQKYQNSLTKLLLAKGYQIGEIENLFMNLTHQISKEGAVRMPSGALAPNNMQFLLNREIKQHIRYGTPFSSLLISIKKVIKESGIVRPSKAETEQLFPQLFSVVRRMMRDIDLIGTVDGFEPPALFVILSMTDEKGASIVKDRVKETVEAKQFTLQHVAVRVQVAVSLTVQDKECIRNLKAYLEKVHKNHQNELLSQ
ncbi:MAG: hypothetical protein GX640_08705 [Fibrobacter sp.]|nr:hypothetical protein [Fibrobacter sp.]